jgi:hypothetical protein
MRRLEILQRMERDLVKDLKKTVLSLKELGGKYGVSRQVVHNFSKRHGIKRPVKSKGHQTQECRLCQRLIQISKKPHSEFISILTIMRITGESRAKNLQHLRMLKARGLVSQRLGRLRSKRVEKAYAIYLTKRLPISTIGQKVGLTNLYAVIKHHRKWGYDVPPSRYVYDTGERSRVWTEVKRRKQR